MIKKILKKIISGLFLKFSKKVDEPIIVFESDDWGSLRNLNKQSIEKIQKELNLKLDNYQKLDCLETNEDILKLADVLKKHKDSSNNYAKFTLNYVMHNLNFDACVKSGFNELKEEKLLDTYSKNQNSNNIISIIKENQSFFRPQFHCFEHFNYEKIKNSIKQQNVDRLALENGCIGMNYCKYSNLDTCNTSLGKENIENKLLIGLQEFESVFGFKSQSIIFPCYVWEGSLEKICKNYSVKYLQGKNYQNVPKGLCSYKRKINFMGKKSKEGLIYLTRNIDFETSKYYLKNISKEQCVEEVFKNINKVLLNKVPAVICTHRVNYVSEIDKGNRDYALFCLDELLNKILKNFPNAKFMFSDELGELYNK